MVFILESDIVYSQPADTGTGTNINTQLVYAVNHLKVGLPRIVELSSGHLCPTIVYTKPYAAARHCDSHEYTP